MEINLWMDYACPYCFVDFTRLQEAIKNSQLADVKINIHAFQIAPNAPKRADGTKAYLLEHQEHLTKEEVKQRVEPIKELGETAGLTINDAQTKSTNTMDAHRLVQWVEHELNDQEKAVRKLLDSDEYRDLVIEQENILQTKDGGSVPYMEIDSQAYVGMQNNQTLKQALNAGYYDL